MLGWRGRMHMAGLRQRTIARLLGWSEGGVSKGLRRDPVPGPIRAVISAWEVMPPQQRADWLAAHGLRHRLPRQRLVSPGLPAKSASRAAGQKTTNLQPGCILPPHSDRNFPV